MGILITSSIDKGKTRMDKYFKVPMAAARAIVDSSDGPDLLAGYVVMNRWAIKPEYSFTAAGAQAIRNGAGVSDCKSKRVLSDLLSLRFGERGDAYLIENTGKKVKNARKYRLGEWEGPVAYLPDLLVQGDPTPLSRLIKAEREPEVRRDALLMLLHVHANVDYAEFLGADPEAFVYREWTGEGTGMAGDDPLDLGYMGDADGLYFWLMRENDDGMRFSRRGNAEAIYGAGELTMERFWAAHSLLIDLGLLCRVAMVSTTGGTYPLWVYSPAYREALKRTGVTADLGKVIYRVADNAGLDPDNIIIRTVVDGDTGASGTGLFFVATIAYRMPVVKTIYAPMFHAPTPLNLAGLVEMTERIAAWMARLNAKPQVKRQAGMRGMR